MDFEIVRVEKTKNREGHDEVFVQMNYLDSDTGTVIPYSKWLSQTEQEQFLKDENALELVLVPKWEPFAAARHVETKAAEEAGKLTMEKAIAVLVDAGAMTKVTAVKFTQEQVSALETAAKAIDAAKVDAVVEAKALEESPIKEEPLEAPAKKLVP